MSFDALTLSAVRAELEPLLVDARVQKLAFVDELSIAVEVFKPGAGRVDVLLSAHAEQGRVQRIRALPSRELERDTPFSLLARKHLRSARIRSIHQPRLERVLELDCEQRDASGEHYGVLLIVEVMGRRSNLVLVAEDGAIMDAARRSPPSRNPRRPVLPHLRYEPPPPQDRSFPEHLTTVPGDLRTLAGLSPQAARELEFRLAGAADLATMRAFFEPPWSPTVAYQDGQPVAYAPYRLTHLEARGAQLQTFDSISQAMDVFYAAAPLRPRGDTLAAERRALLAPLERQLTSIEKRISALEHQLTQADAHREPLRAAGELILTHQAQLAPGSSSLRVDGADIELDPTLTAVENAQAYFGKYRKAREAAERVPALLEDARNELAYLSDLRTLIELADSMDAIRALRREVSSPAQDHQKISVADSAPVRQRASGTRGQAPRPPFRRIPLANGYEALVGTSATGNAHVTFELAKPDDLWLHARGVPGAHVILRGAADPPPDVLERAASLAAWYSAARDSSSVEVDIAPKRHVRKIPSAQPGLVRYTNERTVRISPKPPESLQREPSASRSGGPRGA